MRPVLHPEAESGGRAITAAAVVMLVVAPLQLRPLRVAAATSVLLALALAHHSLGLGFSIAASCFVVLLGACFAISTVLHVRQSRLDRRNRSGTNG